jgi:uncharacterized membrane protein
MAEGMMGPAFTVGVVTFEGEHRAGEVVEGLTKSGDLGLVNDISVLEHHADGKFSVNTYAARASQGAHIAGGALVGVAAGALLFGPFGLLLGLAGGAGVGASMGGDKRHELLLPDDFVKSIRDALPPSTSALLVIGDAEPVDQVIGHLRASGTVSKAEFTHALTPEQSKHIHDALEAAGG